MCPPRVWVVLGLTVTSWNRLSNVIKTEYSRPLSIVTPFGHNAIFEKMVIIGRCDYRQGKSLMFYYESDTEGGGIIGNVSYGVTINEGIIDRD